MKEIIDAAKTNNNPIVEVKLKKEFENIEKMYKKVKNSIEKT